jgi:hypothetical protein
MASGGVMQAVTSIVQTLDDGEVTDGLETQATRAVDLAAT